MFLLARLVCPFIIQTDEGLYVSGRCRHEKWFHIYFSFRHLSRFISIPFFPQVGATRRLGTMTAQKATCPGTETTNGLVRKNSLFSAHRDSSVHSTPVTFHSRTRPVEIEAYRYWFLFAQQNPVALFNTSLTISCPFC